MLVVVVPPDDDEPRVRGHLLLAISRAAKELWGADGYRDAAARLPERARKETVDTFIVTTSWYPLEHLVSWHHAAWDGPCRESEGPFCRFIDTAFDLSFGRVRRFLLGFATTELMLRKAAQLWRHDHTHGTLTAEPREKGAVLTLQDHPFTRSASSRLAFAEGARHAATLVRARDVRETHALEAPDKLVVRVTWSSG
jgi:hypothetical protein